MWVGNEKCTENCYNELNTNKKIVCLKKSYPKSQKTNLKVVRTYIDLFGIVPK